MKNPVAFFFAILAIVLAFVALYGSRAEADTLTAHGPNGSMAEVTVAEQPHGTHHIVCSGGDVGEIVTICRATLIQLCPNGGQLSNAQETPYGVMPARIEFDVVCTEDGTS